MSLSSSQCCTDEIVGTCTEQSECTRPTPFYLAFMKDTRYNTDICNNKT